MSRKHIFYFSMPILIAVVLLMSWNGQKVVAIFGDAVFSPTVFFKEFSYTGMFRKVLYDVSKTYGRSFNFISFFAPFGFISLYKNDKKLWGLMLAFLLPFLLYFFNLGLFSGDHLIISFIPVSLMGAYALQRCLETLNAVKGYKIGFIILVLFFYGFISFEVNISRQLMYARELQRVIQTLSGEYQKNGIMIADYNFGVSFWTRTREESSKDILEGRPKVCLSRIKEADEPVSDKIEGPFWVSFVCIRDLFSEPSYKSIIERRPIYLVERLDWPVGVVQTFKAFLIRMGFEHPVDRPRKMNNIREYLEYKLGTHLVTNKIIDSPLHPVYLMKAK